MFKKGIEISASYKDSVGKVWFGPILGIFLRDPRDIELILGSPVHLHKTSEYDFFKPWFANGLLISTGRSKHDMPIECVDKQCFQEISGGHIENSLHPRSI